MNDTIVAGFDSVSTNVPAKAPASPGRAATCAACEAGAARQTRHASASRNPPPKSASGTRAAVSARITAPMPNAPTAP